MSQIISGIAAVEGLELPTRTDARWNHLRSLEELRKRVGHVIELPIFPGYFPKGFNETIAQRLLLTKERFDLVEEVFQSVQLGSLTYTRYSGVGMILSGPNGVSKTVVSYLLMSILYVNNAIVVYIVRPLVVSSKCFIGLLIVYFRSQCAQNGSGT